MSLLSVPYRIKVTALKKDNLLTYNRSLYHRQEMLFSQKALELQTPNQSLTLQSQQVVSLPANIRVNFKTDKIDKDQEHLGFLLAIGDPYLEAVSDSFIATPEINQLFAKMQILSVDRHDWKYLNQVLTEMNQTQSYAKTQLQQKRLFALTCQLLVDCCHLFEQKHLHPHIRDQRYELATAIAQFIDSHLAEDLPLSLISKRFAYSSSTLNRLFEEFYHSTLHQYIINKRLDRAQELISQGESIQNTWQKVGFNDYSSFYRAFKKHYHYPPHDLRKH
ncbi:MULTISPECIES: helix-turn-helix domain-containing protein [Aerococcus]|uniref:Helix-turn-helix transcriptional regulator n=1 Tax=Aerococcus tenax TaxID=3078812 RepID=A0A5N1BP57_9LACT|nr:AraC family transcriptional regulator [Aerococcus urinae]KAA9241476.1 helix-turn-helix transcriptional regulator [Aerococcus urinae]MDK6370750.1 AraC family transcriptional regulator [Aerococcus urinae]MDK6597381.1 AraC family transcriptional regulator [Aerococcus urinae]MDK7302043.1 AraC family transcriptional regulator [Aerococcus urinae]MDK7801007.1 AraC family transcriptional regulator [Aerococcus urinae]